MSPDAFLPLTPAAFEILLALAEGEAHGYAIMAAVEKRSSEGVRMLPGTLYRVLNRLLDSRLIREIEDGGDDRRRSYRITPLGKKVLRAETERLSEQVRAAQALGFGEAEA